MIKASICLTDIPQDRITVGRNGKKYLNIIIDQKQNVDQYGNTHAIYVSQTKEERTAKATKTYLGNGVEVKFQNSHQAGQQRPPQSNQANFYNPAPESPDDLPF